ncbi:MAG TPA: translation initiation factor IF-2 N-terminal domain-containing protein, partial [Bacillota bacterium]|nr:translation initiation factor IF-2 N-terminal domain-containing protein [Bacillota bacterium]
MGKIRIYELAKELGIQSKELVAAAKELNINVNNHMSALEDGDIALIKGHMGKQDKKTEAAAKKIEASKSVQTPKHTNKKPQQTEQVQQKPPQ